MKTSISFLKSNYEFEKTIDLITKSKADLIHVDVIDGLFVNNKTIFTKKMLEILNRSTTPKDIHLVTIRLKDYIDAFSFINPEFITFALEASANPIEVIKYIKDKNIKVGVSINPLTRVNEILPLLKELDLVLIMSVNPGYGGQKFVKESINKIKELDEIRRKEKLKFLISIDGGINDSTIKEIDRKMLDIVVAGSFVCCSADFNDQINKLF